MFGTSLANSSDLTAMQDNSSAYELASDVEAKDNSFLKRLSLWARSMDLYLRYVDVPSKLVLTASYRSVILEYGEIFG